MIAFFINDTSIHGQFGKHSFYVACNTFLDLLVAIKKVQAQNQLFMCRSFYYKEAIANENIKTSIKSSRDLNLRFASIFDRFNLKFWNDNPVQQFELQYLFEDINYAATTLAEAAEAKHTSRYDFTLLINFKDSIFANRLLVPLVRADGTNQNRISLTAQINESSFIDWLECEEIPYPTIRVFEHNVKHHINVHPEGDVSKLECNFTNAQILLDSAISEDGLSTKKLFNFDEHVEKYIVFRKHENNRYHAYHESNFQRIPNTIKQNFNKY